MIATQIRIGHAPRLSFARRALRVAGRVVAVADRIATYLIAFAWIAIFMWFAPTKNPLAFVAVMYLASQMCAPLRPKRPARPVEHGAPRRMSTAVTEPPRA